MKVYAPWLKSSAPLTGANGNRVSTDANGLAVVDQEDLLALMEAGLIQDGEPFIREVAFNSNNQNTFPANCLAFGKVIILTVTGSANVSLALGNAANIAAMRANSKTWDSWLVRVINLNSGNLTIADGDNAVGNGMQVIGANKWAELLPQIIDMGEQVGVRIAFYFAGFGAAV
jgi:hypothetical protein